MTASQKPLLTKIDGQPASLAAPDLDHDFKDGSDSSSVNKCNKVLSSGESEF